MRHLTQVLCVGALLVTAHASAQTNTASGSSDPFVLLETIEAGEADAGTFLSFIGTEQRRIRALSAAAVANYLETLANEGMLGFLNPELLETNQIWTALDVVFEDPANVARNRAVFESYGQLGELESGSASAAVFISAMREDPSRLRKLSASAVANYLEALANEGMLELIPLEYYREKVLLTAMGVIFEDPGNIARNWRVLDEYVHSMTSSACPC